MKTYVITLSSHFLANHKRAGSGVGIQLMELTNDFAECIIGDHHHSYVTVAKNDGLHPADWIEWFSAYDLSKPMAIIHFAKFRY